MKRIVVGIEGSPGSSEALRWASSIASHGAEVIAMTSFTPAETELPPEQVSELVEEQRRRLEQWRDTEGLDDLTLRTEVTNTDPRPDLLELAQREDADLIVVGRTGRSAARPGVWHLGSVAEWLAHHADRPIAIIGGSVTATPASVIVGIDGSEGSRAAQRWVADLGLHSDIRATAASVGIPHLGWESSLDEDGWRRNTMNRIREDWASDLMKSRVEMTPLAVRGTKAADLLLQAAKEEDSDLIVVGMRGLGGFTGLRVGGVALKVLHRTDRPIVLVPPM